MDGKSKVADDLVTAPLSHLTLEDEGHGELINIPDSDECLIMMLCGVHKRPDGVSTRPAQYEDSRNHDDKRYRRWLFRGEKRGQCICDYYDFSTLREERQEEISHIQQRFPFTRLPAELQVKVLKHMFTCDYLEFCPEPFKLKRFNSERDHDGYFAAGDKAYKDQQDSLRDKIQGFGKFPRANRSIHAEASKILYRDNEFRFTNVTGWTGLDRLMMKIDMNNCKHLRRITVCHPDSMPFPRSINAEGHFYRGIFLSSFGGYDTKGTFYTKRWFDDEKFSRDPILVLQKLGQLEKLCLVLPSDCDRVVASPFDETKFSKIKTTFASVKLVCEVSVYDRYLKRDVSNPADPPTRSVNDKSFAQETVVREGNPKWFWEEIEIDGSGNYQHPGGSQDDLDPVIDEVEDENGDQ